MSEQLNFETEVLGPCKIDSPVKISSSVGDNIVDYTTDDQCILYNIDATYSNPIDPASLQRISVAGPRQKIYFNPSHVNAGIVTCGGICPGLNTVIRSIVRCLWYSYGVKRIIGIRNGYPGFLPEYNYSPMSLTPDTVDDIHKMGGTILGTARGGGDRVEEIADSIERMNLNILFCIGGDGTLRGARDVSNECKKRGLKVSVIGIPKTIDNDINLLQRSFGFETAVAKACEAVFSAHVEAKSAHNGIGLVKLMGRHSGFIACNAAIASAEANFVLIPEVKFDLYGDNGLFAHLEKRIASRKHAVIIVAEGAGQDYVHTDGKDASGNKKLGDIGTFLKEKIKSYFEEKRIPVTLKYIDPSYIIRTQPADPNDSFYCSLLGAHAVHAAMAGKTNMLVSLLNDRYVYLPIDAATCRRNYVNPEGHLWRDVLETTQQPVSMTEA